MNHSISPFLPQLQRYQKPGAKQEPPASNYQQSLHMLHQPIPSIVVNPHFSDPLQDPSVFYRSHDSLPAPEPLRKVASQAPQAPQAHIPVHLATVYTPVGQQPAGQRSVHPNPNAYPLEYGHLHTQPQMYYMPLSHMYPQFRPQVMFPDSYLPMGAVKVQNDSAHYPFQQTYPHRTQRAPTEPQPQMVSNYQGDLNANAVELVESKTYKPTQTKKNSRPKINKIVGDLDDVRIHSERRARFEVGEPSLDVLYEHCREVLGIPVAREDISVTYECMLSDNLEKKLFEMFLENIVVFIDVFLSIDMFQKIFMELALYDESRMILNSMFCLSSLILQRTQPDSIDPLCPLKYYERTVTSIRFHLSLPEVENPESGILARCLLSTCLLCIYELFFVAVDSTYIKGAGSILMSILSKKNRSESLLKSNPFYETCFWAMFICDMILSKKLHMPNMYSMEKVWSALEPEYFSDLNCYTAFLEEPKTIKDSLNNYYSVLVSRSTTIWWQHKIVLIYCSINDFMLLTDVITEEAYKTNKRLYQWQQLRKSLEEYDNKMPVFLKPLIHIPSSKDRVYPVLYFKDEHTAVAALHFKLAKLALVEALHANINLEFASLLEPEFAKYPASLREKTSRDILGILQTYDSNRRIWPVSVHSLRQASKWIKEGTEEHRELKILASRVLQFSHVALRLLVVHGN
ncbi:CIC11C00000002435 [Sungouiella intermedia]|uniref:CIC11C00000002435 n=1 Tax=Sungouiella intermedia TaxID=45354 RepID=A0A1L0BA33_9ASCO|nr:CIC11C00000002435 [[Candida] intermedia]